MTAVSLPPGPPAEQLWALATTLAWGPRSSWDSRLSADGETIAQAKLGSVGSPGDHGLPTMTHRAARQGLEMPPRKLLRCRC